MAINVSGSFVIGIFGALTLSGGRYPAPEVVRIFVMIGLFGGYTAFYYFSLQTLDLICAAAMGRALLNAMGSVMICLAAVALGHVLVARLNGGASKIAQLALEEEGKTGSVWITRRHGALQGCC
jgi:fluoride exporter